MISTPQLFSYECANDFLCAQLQYLFMGRLLQGVGVGMITIAVPLYLSESMPASMRGRGLVAFQLFLTIGIFAASWVNVLFAPSQNWRDMFAAGIPGGSDAAWLFYFIRISRLFGDEGRFDKVKRVLNATRSEKKLNWNSKSCKKLWI